MKRTITAIFLFLAFTFTCQAHAYNVVKLNPAYVPNPIKGVPVSLGEIYVGVADADPTVVANQIAIYVQEEDGTITAVSQPVTLGAGGVPLYNGSPVSLLVEGNYSLAVLSSTGAQIYYIPSDQDVVKSYPSGISLDDAYACDLAAAVAGIGVVDITTLKVDCDPIIAEGTTATSTPNITLEIENGSIIDGVAGGGTETLVINGGLIAAPGQRWIGANLTPSGSTKVDKIYPDWHTQNAVAGTTDMQTAVQLMIDWLPSKVHLLGTTYYCSGPLTGVSSMRIKGEGRNVSVLKSDYAGIFLDLSNTNYAVLEDLQLYGMSKVAGSIGLYADTGHHIDLRRVMVRVFETNTKFEHCIYHYYYDFDCMNGVYGYISTGNATGSAVQAKWYGGRVMSNTGIGVQILYSTNEAQEFLISGVDISSNGVGEVIDGAKNIRHDTVHYEANTTDHVQVKDTVTAGVYNLSWDNSQFNTLVGGGINFANAAIKKTEFKNSTFNSMTFTNGGTYYSLLKNVEEVGATVTGKVIREATGSTYPETKSFTSTQTLQIVGNKNFDSSQHIEYVAAKQTTDATVTTLASWSLLDETSYVIEATVSGKKSDTSQRAEYKIIGLFYRDGAGNATQQGATTVLSSIESDAAWDCVFDVSSTLARIRVTGAAATTVDWDADIKVIYR